MARWEIGRGGGWMGDWEGGWEVVEVEVGRWEFGRLGVGEDGIRVGVGGLNF